MTGECKSAWLAWHEATLDIESSVAKSDLSYTFRAQELEPQIEALQRGEPVEVASETGLQPRHWSQGRDMQIKINGKNARNRAIQMFCLIQTEEATVEQVELDLNHPRALSCL